MVGSGVILVALHKNKVYYFDFWHHPLKLWINIEKLLNNNKEHFLYNNIPNNYLILIFLILFIIISLLFKRYLYKKYN